MQGWGDSVYVNLPIITPTGASATVRITPAKGGFRVDDGGFAYREIESIGAERSFSKVAAAVASSYDIAIDRRTISIVVPDDGLTTAICEIAMASRDIADRIYAKKAEHDENEIEEFLSQRLEQIFGRNRIEHKPIIGASTNEWNVSAILHSDSGLVVFQAVGKHPNSVYRASAAFHDLAELPSPPTRVAVVKDKASLGPKLNVLAQAGRVIQGDQTDEVYERAAA